MPSNTYTLLTKPVQRQPDRTVATYETMAEDYLARQTEGSWRRRSLDHFSAVLPGAGPPARGWLRAWTRRPHLREAGYTVLALDRTWAMLRLAESSGAPAHPGRQPGAAAAGRQRGRRVGQRLAPASIAHRTGDRAGRDPPAAGRAGSSTAASSAETASAKAPTAAGSPSTSRTR